MTSAIIAIGILYFIGHVLTHFFDKAKVPDVLILIIFGILVGPVFGLVNPEMIGVAGQLFTSIALIVILFEGGLGLSLTNLVSSAKQATVLTTSFFGITTLIVFVIMKYGFDFSSMASLLTGFICAGTSSAVVIPMVNALKVGKEATTVLILESALTDVLCIVFTIGVLQSIKSGNFEIGKIIGSLISSLVLASVIGIAGGVFWLRVIDKIRKNENTQFATFFFMFLLYGLAEMLDFSGAIASLAFGIVLGNNYLVGHSMGKITGNVVSVGAVSEVEKMLYREIVFLTKIFFFTYLGISIPFTNVEFIMIALSIVAVVYIARPMATKFLVNRGVNAFDKTIISVMVPKGLAAAVLAGLPGQYEMVEAPSIQAVTYNIILFSIVLTSILIPLIEKTPVGNMFKAFMNTGVSKRSSEPLEIEESNELPENKAD
ncbi:MAG: cation:proton antiporter [Marinilabiliaceae bacterium]|nr:cation:proton antiporter [Marinilabiliaceae bacterium]